MADYQGGYMAQGDMNEGGASQEQRGGAGPSPPRRLRDNKTLMPVTIKQLVEARVSPDDVFKIGDVEITQVSFIGLIRSMSVQTSNVNYTLDDGTGVIEAKEWKQTEESEYVQQQRALRHENMYVRVVGMMRLNKERRNFTVHHMRPIEDYNEITYHYLEAIQAHLYYTRGGAARAAAAATASHAGQGGAAPAPNAYGAPVVAPSYGGGYTAAAAPPQQSGYRAPGGALTGNAAMAGLPAGLTVPQGRVMQAIKQERSAEGAHVEAIAQKLGMTVGEVRKIVEYLSEEGHIFSTTDEHHYLPTDS